MLIKNLFLIAGIYGFCVSATANALEEFTFENLDESSVGSSATDLADLPGLQQQKPLLNQKKAAPAPVPMPAKKPEPKIDVKAHTEKNIVLPASSIESTIYMHPGMITYRDNKWIGGDHLFNVSKNIPVAVELLLPADLTVTITDESIRDQITEIFKKVDITTNFEFTAEKPPLPFFHFLVMVHPIEKGYVACCDGRLFEDVHLNRVILDPLTAIQGITWEKQSLIVFPEKLFEEQIKAAVEDIATTFSTRYEAYEKLKNKQK